MENKEIYCKVLKDVNGNLVVTMPDGKIIPGQIKLSISDDFINNVGDLPNVIIEFTSVIVIPVNEFNLVKDLIPVSYD